MKQYIMWVVVVVALLAGIVIGFVVERQRAIGTLNSTKLMYQSQIDQVKTANQKLTSENKQLQMSLTPTPTGEVKKGTPGSTVGPK